MTDTNVITCERCGRTTTDPDLWDPEADTGRVFCNNCWEHRNEPQNHGDWAASARQSAKYAAEDAVRAITIGNFSLARQSLKDALGLLDEADALERGEK